MSSKEILKKEMEEFKKLTAKEHLDIARKMVEGLAKRRKK